jgi:ankyrin repeat protein
MRFLKKNPQTISLRVLGGYTLFHYACQMGCLKITLALLHHKRDFLNHATIDGCTALHLACQNGHLDIVFVLLKKGAILESNAFFGNTPLHLACQNGHLKIAQTLLRYGSNPTLKNDEGNTPLHLACNCGQTNIIKMLLEECRLEIDVPGAYGNTPLMIACNSEVAQQNSNIFKLLLSKGASLKQTNIDGDTALDLAVINQNFTAVEEIRGFTKNKNFATKFFNPCIYSPVSKGKPILEVENYPNGV